MIFTTRAALLLLATASPALCVQVDPEPLVEPLGAYASSRLRALTCTTDGRWIYEAEGGRLVLVDTWDEGAGGTSIDGFLGPGGSKSFQLGERGVLASALALDPDAAPEPQDGPSELLYVAGGRDGVWVVQADTAPDRENRAWRIDDSGDLQTGSQGSRRWCADVATARVGDQLYLLALFARKDASRLRLYPLDEVRALASSGQGELGGELVPALQVPLGAHPMAPPVSTHASFGGSLALAMAVDPHPGPGGALQADVYVALAHHGLARVELRPGGSGVQAGVTFGPVFGEGSAYETDVHKNLIPPHLSTQLYGNTVQEVSAEYLDAPRVDREELPQVTDVAVLRGEVDGQPTLQLFATVDHLFWLGVDLGARGFAPDTPLLVHAGQELAFTPPHATYELHGMRPLGSTGERFGAGRALEVVEHPGQGFLLVVATWRSSLAKDYFSFVNEGVAYDGDLDWGGGAGALPVLGAETFIYRVGHVPGAGYVFEPRARVTTGGGPGLALPGPAGQDLPEHLRVVHHYLEPEEAVPPGYSAVEDAEKRMLGGVALDIVRIEGGQEVLRYGRPFRHGRGAYAFQAAFDRARPDLVVLGKNDGSLPGPGLLQVVSGKGGAAELVPRHRPTGGRRDERLPLGLLFDPDSQLVEGHAPHERTYLSAGDSPLRGDPRSRWQVVRLRVPPGPAGVRRATRQALWTLQPPPDSFGSPGRWYYMGLSAEPALDQAMGESGSAQRLMFGTRQRSPEGLVVIDRDAAFAWAAANGEQGQDYDLEALAAGGVWSEALVTHPEFCWMPRSDPLLRAYWGQDLANLPGSYRSDTINQVLSWMPEAFQAEDPDVPGALRWVLAAPCGAIQGDPEWNVFDADPGYRPQGLYQDWYGHGLVQFWELWDDPADVPDRGLVPRTFDHPGHDLVPGTVDDVAGCSPLARLVAPGGPRAGEPKGNIYRLRTLEVESGAQRRVYLFCVDFAGRLFVYSVEGVLGQGDPTTRLDDSTFLVETWLTPQALSDGLPSALHDVVVDPAGDGTALVLAAVRRVGVVVLRFDPAQPQGSRLVELSRIQTPGTAVSLDLSRSETGERQLLVSDLDGGVRLYRVGR